MLDSALWSRTKALTSKPAYFRRGWMRGPEGVVVLPGLRCQPRSSSSGAFHIPGWPQHAQRCAPPPARQPKSSFKASELSHLDSLPGWWSTWTKQWFQALKIKELLDQFFCRQLFLNLRKAALPAHPDETSQPGNEVILSFLERFSSVTLRFWFQFGMGHWNLCWKQCLRAGHDGSHL